MTAEDLDIFVQTLLSAIRAETAHREGLLRHLLDLAERGQDTAEAHSALREAEDNLAGLRERLVQLDAE